MIREFFYRLLCRLAPNEVRARIAGIRSQEGMITLLVAAADKAGAKDAVLERLLAPGEREVLALLRQPDRWRSGAELLKPEADAWASLLRGPVGQKLELAMQNATVQQAQRACLAKPDHMIYAAGFASGFRASWAIAKTLSVAADAPAESEDPVMEGANLEHLSTP